VLASAFVLALLLWARCAAGRRFGWVGCLGGPFYLLPRPGRRLLGPLALVLVKW